MKKAKSFMLLLLVFAIAFSLAACGSKSGGDEAKSSDAGKTDTKTDTSTDTKTDTKTDDKSAGNATGEKVKLQYWTSSRHDTEYITAKIKEFNETNKSNIEVEMTTMAENYGQSVDLAFSSDQAPDVFQYQTADFQKKGYIEPLNSYLDDEMKNKFSSAFQEGVSVFNGDIISLGNFGTTIRLVYNADIFEKLNLQPPKTLDEMVETAKKITEYGKKDGIYGWAMNYKAPASSLSRSLGAIAQANGMPGYDYKTGRYDYSGWKPIVEAFRKMMADGSTLPGAESLDMDPLRAQFAEGKIGMYISYSYEPGVYRDQFPAKIKWAAAPVPTISGGELNGIISVGGQTWLVMSNKSKHKKEAWEFMKFMYSDDVLRGYHENGYGLSIMPHVLKGAKAPSIPGMEYFVPTKYDGNWPLGPTGLTLEGKDWYDLFIKYILTGSGSVDEMIKDLNTRWNAALDKAVQEGKTQVVTIPDFDPKKLQIDK